MTDRRPEGAPWRAAVIVAALGVVLVVVGLLAQPWLIVLGIVIATVVVPVVLVSRQIVRHPPHRAGENR